MAEDVRDVGANACEATGRKGLESGLGFLLNAYSWTSSKDVVENLEVVENLQKRGYRVALETSF